MFKVFIERRKYLDIVDLYCVSDSNSSKHFYLSFDDKGRCISTAVEDGEQVKPFISMTGIHADSFLQSLAEGLDREGIKTDKDAKIQGTLEATKYHLEDLRVMLKLNKK